MIKKTLFALSLITLAGSAFAAQIQFIDKTNNFYAKAAGITGLDSLTKVGGNTYAIQNDSQGRVVNTTVQMVSGTTPPFTEAQGNIQWNDSANGYQVAISAGALYQGGTPSQCFTMTVAINGTTIGSNTTNAQGRWAPTIVNNVTLGNLVVTTTPSACV